MGVHCQCGEFVHNLSVHFCKTKSEDKGNPMTNTLKDDEAALAEYAAEVKRASGNGLSYGEEYAFLAGRQSQAAENEQRQRAAVITIADKDVEIGRLNTRVAELEKLIKKLPRNSLEAREQEAIYSLRSYGELPLKAARAAPQDSKSN